MRTIFINNTITENHIGCTLAIQSCYYYFKKYNIRITDTIYTNNLYKFYKKNYLNYDIYLINGEGTLNNKNEGKGEYLLNIIKILIKNKKKIVLINCSIDLSDKNCKLLSNCSLISVREKKSYNKLKDSCKKGNLILTGDLIFNKFIEKKLYTFSKVQRNKNINILWFDTSLKPLREKVFKKAKENKFIYKNLLIKPQFFLIRTNPLRYLKYYLYSTIVLFFPYFGRSFNSLLFSHRYQIINIKNLISIINQSKIIVTGRFHMTCILILLKKTFIAYEANTFKIESCLNDFKLKNFFEKDILNANYIEKKYQNKQIKAIDAHMKYLRANQNLFFKKVSEIFCDI